MAVHEEQDMWPNALPPDPPLEDDCIVLLADIIGVSAAIGNFCIIIGEPE